jgi:hypothetical protein
MGQIHFELGKFNFDHEMGPICFDRGEFSFERENEANSFWWIKI